MLTRFPFHPAHAGGAFLLPCILTRCRAFIFARIQYSSIQAFTARFTVSMQLYSQRHKTAHRALQRLFLRLCPLNRPRYQTDTNGYNTTRATLERIHAPGRAQPIPDTTATLGRCTGQHRPPIIIRYIRVQNMPVSAGQCLPCADRWQVLPPYKITTTRS